MTIKRRFLIRGVGIGFVIAATLFFFVMTFTIQKPTEGTLTDTQIIEKARLLGMIFVSELATEAGQIQGTTQEDIKTIVDGVQKAE